MSSLFCLGNIRKRMLDNFELDVSILLDLDILFSGLNE
jgi:hypothetical protein